MQRQAQHLTLLRLRIAEVRIDLDAPGSGEVAARFGTFAVGRGPARWRLAVRPSRAPRLDGLTRHVVPDGRLLRIEGAEALGWIDLAARRGAVVSDPPGVVLEPLLRAVVATEVAGRGGCLFHAAAVRVGAAGHLVPGRSGSGKSTFASLAGDRLADEVAAVLPAGGGFRVHGTPWWSGRPGSAPLAAVHALAWGGEGVEPLAPAEALRHLTASLVVPCGGAPALARAFAVASAVAAAVPFGRLSFRRDSDVDAILRLGAAARAA